MKRAMKGYKKFFSLFLLGFMLFIALNALIWHTWTKSILVRGADLFVGDLARVGYLPDYADPRPNLLDLPARHLELSEYRGQPIDLLTIGDSFSNGLGFGPNRYYQDFLASRYGIQVLNLPPLTSQKDLLDDIAVMANSGYLRKLGVRHVLLELAERNCLSRLNAPMDTDRTLPLAEVERIYQRKAERPAYSSGLPEVKFINTGNLKFLINRIGYLFSDKAIFGGLYKAELTRPMFEHAHGQTLIFIDKDIRKLHLATEENIQAINANLNRLAQLLKAQGVTLHFLPAPNKYTLYSPYLADPSYPQGRFFEILRDLPKSYRFIDSEQILRQAVENGTLNIYYIDDTHWSEKASRLLVEHFDLS